MSTENNGKNEERLLTAAERDLLSQIAAGEPPSNQRAQALLAIDEGATQAAASHLAGLTVGQVRYWLGRFRAERASIFPPEALAQPPEETALSPHTPDEPLAPADQPDAEAVVAEEEPQPQMLVTAAADNQPAASDDAPADGKKSKKKGKKQKRVKKEKKAKKKDKKPKKGKGKKGKKSKEKGSKGKSGKKNKKKRKKRK